MPTLLQLDASIDPETSVSRGLTARFAAAWRARGADHDVVIRDLAADPVPHLPHASLHWPPRLRPADAPEFPDAEALQQRLIDDLAAADALLVGAPMYNYSLPSSLKAWLDHVHVPGVTAPFDRDTQPLRGRPAIVVSTRGAIYDPGSGFEDWDHTVPPLQIVLGGALGMDVRVVTVSRTLSTSTALLAAERDRYEAELTAAETALVELAATL